MRMFGANTAVSGGNMPVLGANTIVPGGSTRMLDALLAVSKIIV